MLLLCGVKTYLFSYFAFSSGVVASFIFCAADSDAAAITPSDKPSNSSSPKINSKPFVSANKFCPNCVESSDILELIFVISSFWLLSKRAPLLINCFLVSFNSFICSSVRMKFSRLFQIDSTRRNKPSFNAILS